MAEPSWPERGRARLIGSRIDRIDGLAKVRGAATYTADVKRPGMLYARVARCPHAHARIRSIDLSAADAMPGVKATLAAVKPGDEIQWSFAEVAYVAAVSEQAAEDAVRAVRVNYEVLPHAVHDDDPSAPGAKTSQEETTGDPDGAMARAKVRASGSYGAPAVAHACLEPHGHVVAWSDEATMTAWSSTQAVSSLPGQFAEGLDLPAANVRVVCDHIGGGFGSKFSPDAWGIACAELARKTGAPVRLMLDRDAELTVAGDRPSAYAEVELGADAEGRIVSWASRSWGSGGPAGSGSPPIPYVFDIPDRRHVHVSIPTHTASARAWRAPNHPQACLVTMAALEDLAAAAGMDPLDLFLKNIDRTGPRADVYREQLRIGADRIGWKKLWRPRGISGGRLRRGLGLSLHTWGGRGHRSACDVTIHPDGSVEAKLGSQDLGTGTRTVIAIVVAETLGLGIDAVRVSIGDSRYPPSGSSGGSTTVGGVSASSRRAALRARDAVLEKVAPTLGTRPDQLEVVEGAIRVRGVPDRAISWARAAARLGPNPQTFRGENPGPGKLNDSGVGGIQMAAVEVDAETGVVRIDTMVAVQDCGLVIDAKTAESQVYGGMIMGIGYALTEELIYDGTTGRLLNPNMERYKLPGIGDVGKLIVHLMTGPGHDERGTIGLGEPPVISPGAALSNAVANAIGIRVRSLPLTPDRVLAAIEQMERRARG